ncbi:hypothetical protein [Staphylococcus phage PT94]
MYPITGFIVSLIFLLSYFPQLKSLYNNKNIKGVSILFWVLISVATAITFHNLASSNAVWYVVIPQFINAFIALTILLLVSFKKGDIGTMFIYLMVYVFVITVFVFQDNLDFIQHSASALIFLAYLYQIIKMVVSKTSEGVNFLLFIGFGLGLGIMATNILLTGAPIEAAITELVNLTMICIATGVTLFYNYKKKL